MADTTIYQTCTATIDEAELGSLLKCVADQAQLVRTLSHVQLHLMCSCYVVHGMVALFLFVHFLFINQCVLLFF